MEAVLFYIFCAIMLVSGVMVIVSRNPVSSALALVVSFIGLAALFILLNAYFIGTIQILVSAGAVVVLFLFIIMLLDVKAGQARTLNLIAFGGGIALTIAFLAQLAVVLDGFEGGRKLKPVLENPAVNDVKAIGTTLFEGFNFPLQVIGVLLLVATVGVVVLSKRELK